MKTLVIAPHPDDELLGAGGTLFRRKAEGGKLAWVIVTNMTIEDGWSEASIIERTKEIAQIRSLFNFDSVFELNFPTTKLDTVPISALVAAISNTFKSFEPTEVFLPHYSDVHSDHRIVFDAAVSCTKWFRHPSIERILTYETLSESDASLTRTQQFNPNVFINIEGYLAKKLNALDIYKSEMGHFPFPRSHETVKSLAALRGSASGYTSAEAFELLRERIK